MKKDIFVLNNEGFADAKAWFLAEP